MKTRFRHVDYRTSSYEEWLAYYDSFERGYSDEVCRRAYAVWPGGEHDNKRAPELCAGIKSGEIVLFDKGYVDFGHLRDLDERGAFWVTRAKDNMAYDVVRKMPKSKDEKILRDEVIVLSNPEKPAPELMRRGWRWLKLTARNGRGCF